MIRPTSSALRQKDEALRKRFWQVPGPLPFLKLPNPCQPKGLAMEAVKRLPSILPTEEVRPLVVVSFLSEAINGLALSEKTVYRGF